MPFPFKNVSVKSMCFSFTSSHFSRSNSSRDSNPAYDQWMGDSITPGLYIGKYKVKGGVKSWLHLAEYFFPVVYDRHNERPRTHQMAA